MTLQQVLAGITPPSDTARQQAHAKQSSMAMPLGGLGHLQDALNMLAGVQGTAQVQIDRRAVVVFCADNGVVAQGVTQCGAEVTAVVTENLAKDSTPVCIMARHAGVDVIPVDIGVARQVTGDKIVQCNVMRGTHDMTKQPAMTQQACEQAILTGVRMVKECQEKGYQLLATGEMGIGNTTTSSAVAAVLLGVPVQQVTGRGAGLSDEGLLRKIDAISRALEKHQPNAQDVVDVLSKVGGLDIAGMVGLCLGGAYYHVPIVIDGFISAVAALCAVRLCAHVQEYLLPSHVSAEPAGQRMLDALHMQPLICAGMHLGEGTGAVAAITLLDLMLAVYREMVSFDDIGIAQYTPQC